jgi:hypothetical protein
MIAFMESAHRLGFPEAARRAGALVTDPPVDAKLKPQWGRPPFLQGKMIAHFWTADDTPIPGHPDAYGMRSACGLTTVATRAVPLLGHGNLPFCERCDRKLLGKIR